MVKGANKGARKSGVSVRSLLLVDDDSSLRRVTEYSLQRAGYQVLTAEDGQRGIELFLRERPPVVVTDIQMPGLSGHELLERIKNESPQTLVRLKRRSKR